MKTQIIACLFFLSTLPILSFGQQTAQQTTRPLTPQQVFEFQVGEVEYFKTMSYRFEIAWEESDIESMVVLQAGLIKLMETEISQASGKTATEKATDRLAKQQSSLEKVKSLALSANDPAFGKKAEQVKSFFQDFILKMEADLTEQAESLRASN